MKSIVLQSAMELCTPINEAAVPSQPDFSELNADVIDKIDAEIKNPSDRSERRKTRVKQTIKDWKNMQFPRGKSELQDQIRSIASLMEDWWASTDARGNARSTKTDDALYDLLYLHIPPVTQLDRFPMKLRTFAGKANDERRKTIEHAAEMVDLMVPIAKVATWLKNNVGKVISQAAQEVDTSNIDYDAAMSVLEPGWKSKDLARLLKRFKAGKGELDKKTVTDFMNSITGYVDSIRHEEHMKLYKLGQEINVDDIHDFDSIRLESPNKLADPETLLANLRKYADNDAKPKAIRQAARHTADKIEKLIPVYKTLKPHYDSYHKPQPTKSQRELEKRAGRKSIEIVQDLAKQVTNEFFDQFVKQVKEHYEQLVEDYMKGRNNENEDPYKYFARTSRKEAAYEVANLIKSKHSYINGDYGKVDDYEKKLESTARRQAEDARARFMNKIVTKIAPIVEHKSTIKSAKPLRINTSNMSNRTFEGRIRIDFEDGSGFTVDNQLVYFDDLADAFRTARFAARLQRYLTPHLLIIDELGYLACADPAANVLFHVVNERHRRHKAMIFTTNKPLSKWGDVLHDHDLASAIIDRILERGRVITLDGPSMRTRHLKVHDPAALTPEIEGARISGIDRTEFPERTGASLLEDP